LLNRVTIEHGPHVFEILHQKHKFRVYTHQNVRKRIPELETIVDKS